MRTKTAKSAQIYISNREIDSNKHLYASQRKLKNHRVADADNDGSDDDDDDNGKCVHFNTERSFEHCWHLTHFDISFITISQHIISEHIITIHVA